MLFPHYCKGRSLQGPHSTCMMTAETFIVRSNRSATVAKSSSSCIYRMSLGRKQFSFHVYFVMGLLSPLLLLILSIMFAALYVWTRMFIRFQLKMSLLLLTLHVHIFDFRWINRQLIFTIHVLMLLIGALGYIILLFIHL